MPMHKAANLLGACPIVKDSHSVSKEKSIRDRLKGDMLAGIDSYLTRRDNFAPTRPQALEDIQG